MEHSKEQQARAMPPGEVDHYLRDLKLAFISQHYGELATQAAGKQWSHVEYLAKLLEGDRATLRLLRANPFPDRPPRYLRALSYRYRFTTPDEHRRDGSWWKRELIGVYVGPVALK